MIKNHKVVFLLFLLSSLIGVFYFFNINLSSDTIMLFLTNRLYLGDWLSKGVFPLFNPYIFAGIPFAFDLGLGNFHPFNIFFLLPYPFSFSIWVAAVSVLFLSGFYLFFNRLTKNKAFSLLLTFIIFFSGNGLLRMSNPTIFIVVAHYGLFFWSLAYLKNGFTKSLLIPLVIGILLILSGHLQFIVYGLMLGFLIGILIYKITLKKLLIYYLLLLASTSWYFIFSLPLILSSTRISEASLIASHHLFISQLAQLVMPFVFGEIRSGARWNIGPSSVIITSLLLTFFTVFLVIKRKIQTSLFVLMIVFLILSFGVLRIPFFRESEQMFIIVQLLALISLARNEKAIVEIISRLQTRKLPLIILFLFIASILFLSNYFTLLFVNVYKLVKQTTLSGFFDPPTISAIGRLIGGSILIVTVFITALFVSLRIKRNKLLPLTAFVIAEGVIYMFFFNFFIPTSILPLKVSLPKQLDIKNYRFQSTEDVIPYSGFHTYVSSVQFRPPFSKESSILTKVEEKQFTKLQEILNAVPSSWSMVAGIKSIQGYNTFVPTKIGNLFQSSSADFGSVYKDIIERNAEFSKDVATTHVNAIDTSRITITDPRWKQLNVRYIISDREISDISLIYTNKRKFYENNSVLPLYLITNGTDKKAMIPSYEDPNSIVFKVDSKDIGNTITINQNPDGFVGKFNDKQINLVKKDFSMSAVLSAPGSLKIYYSPIKHLQEVLGR